MEQDLHRQGKKWTDEEIQFLKFAFPREDFTVKEISKALFRSVQSIKSMAKELGLKRYKEEILEGYKRCSKCKTILLLEEFHRQGKSKNSHCRRCRKEYNKKHKNGVKNKDVPEEIKTKICTKCKIEKCEKEFTKDSKSKDGISYYCKDCMSIINKKYYMRGGY